MPSKNKRIVLAAPNKLQYDEVDIPDAPEKGAVIKIHYAGVCHTDAYFWLDQFKVDDKVTVSFKDAIKGYGFPVVLGHEIAGEVYEIGRGSVTGAPDLKVGDFVLLYPYLGCGTCKNCIAGEGNSCEDSLSRTYGVGVNGGWQMYLSVHDRSLLQPLPSGIPLEVATMLTCSALTAYNGVSTIRPYIERAAKFNEDHARVLIVGAGGLGLWGVQWAKALLPPSTKVFVSDVVASKLEDGKAAGADGTVLWPKDGDNEEIAKKVVEQMGGQIDGSVDFVGAGATVGRVNAAINKNGMQVMVGLAGGQHTFSIGTTILTMNAIKGVYVGSADQMREVARHVGDGKVKAPPVKVFRVDQCEEVIKMLIDGKLNGRGVLDFTK